MVPPEEKYCPEDLIGKHVDEGFEAVVVVAETEREGRTQLLISHLLKAVKVLVIAEWASPDHVRDELSKEALRILEVAEVAP